MNMDRFLAQAEAADYRRFLAPAGIDLAAEEAGAPGRRIVVEAADGAPLATGRLRPLDWDSEFFGVPTGRFEGLFLDPRHHDPAGLRRNLIGDMTTAADQSGLKFLDCRIDGADILMAQALEEQGFRLCDSLAIYSTELTDAVKAVDRNDPDPADRDEVVRLVDRFFAEAPHGRVFQDPAIDNQTARRFYREASRSHLSQGAHVTVIEAADGKPAGVAIGVIDAANSKQCGRRYGILWLFAIDPAHRGQGVGRRLFAKFRREFAANCDLLEIGTQSSNIPANRVYSGGGCLLSAQALTFHRWSDA